MSDKTQTTSIPEPMLVNSAALIGVASAMREDDTKLLPLARFGTSVSANQLESAARLLQGSETSVCNGDEQERPAWLHPSVGTVLKFSIGIIPSTVYYIRRDGAVSRNEDPFVPVESVA